MTVYQFNKTQTNSDLTSASFSMTTEQERLERAKHKLMIMNKKVINAQNMSKKRNIKKAELEPLSPLSSSPRQQSNPTKTSANTYFFELTESMIVDGFSETEVSEYVKQVEIESRSTDLELDQHEIQINQELKKINRLIKRIKDPKIPATPKTVNDSQDDISEAQINSPDSKDPSQKSYLEIQKSRMPQEPEKILIKPPEDEKKKLAGKPTPKRSKLPTKKKEIMESQGESPAIQATGAGAKFLADLLDGDDDPPF